MTSPFNQEWEEKMSDYEPDYVYMIPLAYKSREVYYENITNPGRIRGALLTDEEKKDMIDFQILSPKGIQLYANTTNECLFDLNVTEVGIYQIIFSNKYVNYVIKVTFTMNSGQNAILKKDDLSFADKKLDNLINFIKRFNLEFKLNRNIHQERYKSKHQIFKI
jgi:hypothetical protein